MTTTTTTTTTTTRRKSTRKQYDGPTAEDKLCNALVELLQQGVNPWRRDWAGIAAQGHHRNLITGQHYKGSNPAVLEMWSACRGYSLPLWLGTAQAKAEGWFPRKGSQGCYILRPQLNKYIQEADDGKPIMDPDGSPQISVWISYKPACVFNVADLVGGNDDAQQQLEGRIAAAVGAVTVRPEPERHIAAEAVLGAWPVETIWAGDKAFYTPGIDRITMPTRAQFATAEGLYATWAHEQAHSTGHHNRLGRNLSGSFGSDEYAREELVAELAAFLICNRLEISSNTENHAAYLGSWVKVLKEGPKVLFKVLGQASAACNQICGADVIEAEDA